MNPACITEPLTHDTAPGLGCLRNEHLAALNLNPDRQMSPSAAATIDNYLEYANAVVKVLFPPYFYSAWVASRLVPANKVPVEDLPPGTIPDCIVNQLTLAVPNDVDLSHGHSLTSH